MKQLLTLIIFLITFPAFAWEDPTKGKPFFPWAWNDELKPTIKKSVDKTGLIILGSGLAASTVTHEFDHRIYEYNQEHGFLFGEETAIELQKLGNGVLGVSIAVTQLVFDQENGLKHSRALILTTTSHLGIAALVRRDRPGNNENSLPFASSFPSGHAASAFATAGSLAYSYGWKAGIPSYIVASAISLSRISVDRHWASDVVAGAFLGSFWARASFNADKEDPEAVMFIPAPVMDGMMFTAMKSF